MLLIKKFVDQAATINLLKWNRSHAFLVILATLACLYLKSMTPLLACAVLSITFFCINQKKSWWHFSPKPGWANLMTLFRFFILILSFAYLINQENMLMAYVLILFLILDAFDGYLARKFDQVSDFGKYLDMETDALYVSLITLHLYQDGYLDFWIVLIGLLRYVNVLAEYLFVKKEALDPRLKVAVYIAVALFIALLTPLFFPRFVYFPIVLIASLLVSASFIYTFIYKLRSLK